MGDTTIAWTDKTWNPTTGCTKVSAGCKNCYAERIFHRPYPGRTFTDVRTHSERLDQPLRWRKPCRIFVNSMSDLFHEDISFDFVDRVFAAMIEANWHTYQILTKRPERMLDYLDERQWHDPTDHIWLGVSVEDQATADERIPLLLQTPAAVRFVSYEPALGPVDFSRWLTGHEENGIASGRPVGTCTKWEPPLDWVIVGGESGPKARPFDLDWASQAIHQCKTAGVPVFFKQYGSHPMFCGGRVHLNDRAGADPSEWLDCFRVQEFPQ